MAKPSEHLQADVYSVGLVFYQILTLQHPLIGEVNDPSSFLDWQRAHLYAQCDDVRSLRNEVPVSISQLLARMVSKRPNERPQWGEVLKIISQPEIVEATDHSSVRAAVDALVARKQKEEEQALKLQQKQSERDQQLALYRYSCESLLKQLEPVVEQFNRDFQHGQISCAREMGVVYYRIPSGRTITVTFFEPKMSRIKIRGGEIIGGGWIGISDGRSANLVLIKEGPDDLYGRWVVCEIGIMALTDARELLGRFGLTERTVLPFGFRDSDFYDQMQYATRIVHVFTYNFSDDVRDFFAQFLLEACK